MQNVFPYIVSDSDLSIKEVLDQSSLDVHKAIGYIRGNSLDYYADLLRSLLNIGCDIRSMRHFMESSDAQVIVGLRHDVDHDIRAAYAMCQEEMRLGLSGSYYILHSPFCNPSYYARYDVDSHTVRRNSCLASLYREMQAHGAEIGLHVDAAGLYRHGLDGMHAVTEELAWLRSQGLDIQGMTAHGSAPYYSVENFEFFQEYHMGHEDFFVHEDAKIPLGVLSAQELGLTYEGNWPSPPKKRPSSIELSKWLSAAQTDNRAEHLRFYLHDNIYCHWGADIICWLYGRDCWAISERGGQWIGSATREDVLAIVRSVQTQTRIVLHVHPCYCGLREYVRSKGPRRLRVLHMGNIANNAYSVAKALRERAGIEADCYTDHYTHYISQPEWEDADIGLVSCDDGRPVDWSRVDLHGFQRPEWYFENKQQALRRLRDLVPLSETFRIPVLQQEFPLESENADVWKSLFEKARVNPCDEKEWLALVKGQCPLPKGDFPTVRAWRSYLRSCFKDLCIPPHTPLLPSDYTKEEQQWLCEFFHEYDIIQTYGIHALFYPVLLTPSLPRVTFEHGTMREFPFQLNALGRKAMFAYKTAFANIITNADAIHNAKRMGLKNYVFIPHPVDDEKFHRRPDGAFRSALLNEFGATHLFLALARQNWTLKGNDRIVRGFAQLVRSVGKGPKLLLGAWGQEVQRTRTLVEQLGIQDHVAWLPPLPKRLLARYINACDAVLDQFILGAFGTTTPEAMACGKPVLLHYNAEDHEWCLPKAPPVLNVHDADGIASMLRCIMEKPQWAEQVGKASEEWFFQYHSLDILVQRHMEIYRRIIDAPQCIRVPVQLTAQSSEGKKSLHMKSQQIVCVVDCRSASSEDISVYLNSVRGFNALAVLNARLHAIHASVLFILALSSPAPELEAEARRLGWLVYRPPHGLSRLLGQAGIRGITRLLRTDFAYICTLDQPFMDGEQIESWHILQNDPSTIICGESHNENPYTPLRIYSRAFLVYRFLLRMLFRRHFTNLQCQSIMIRYGITLPAPVLSPDTLRLTHHNSSDLASTLSLDTFTVEKDLKAMPPQRQILTDKLRTTSQPHLLNADLNALEVQEHVEEMHSFPVFVGLNFTSRCSAHCTFCSIQPSEQKVRDAVSLEDVRRMEWLRYVSDMDIWGGIGDSLVNKEFLPILSHLRKAHPHLRLNLSTNGILLNEEICQALAGNLSSFNVSLNAARKDTWEKLMRSKGFDNVCTQIARLAALRPSKRDPYMSCSMVLTRGNIDEAEEFVNLVHDLGVDKVTFVHYVPTTLVGRRDLPMDQSCYLDKARSDAALTKAIARAEALNMDYIGPTLFAKKAEHIHFGARAMTPPQSCNDPWRICYLTVDEDGNRQMIFCCSGFYYAIGYEKDALDEEHFLRLWNHPTARYFRHTVHKKGTNPICTYCTSVDRFNPENTALYSINDKIQPYFSEIDRRYRNGESVSVEEITQYVQDLLR